jgi:integrase
MPFDARAAKLLQPGDHIIYPEHPGLRMQASASRRTWTYRYKSPVDGGMRQVKIGEWPRMEFFKAVSEWDSLRGLRESGIDPQLQKKAARRAAIAELEAEQAGAYTVARLVDDYITGHIDQNRKPKGRAEVRRMLTKAIAPIADEPAEQLTRSAAFDLLQTMSDRPVMMSQARTELGAAWDYGLDSGKLADVTPNWWRQILKGKLPASKGRRIDGKHVGTDKRVLSEREIGLLVNWLPNFSRLVADALTMYLWTGTRGAEIVAIQAAEISEEGGVLWWTLPKGKTKNARRANASDLRVPLIGRARAIVQRRLVDANAAVRDDPSNPGYLFASSGQLGYVEQKTIQSTVYNHQPYAKKRAERDPPRLPVTRWSPHDLRRSVRTLLASMGCPTEIAESVLGHMLPGVLGVYNRHQYDAERLDWLTKLDTKLEQLAIQYAAS